MGSISDIFGGGGNGGTQGFTATQVPTLTGKQRGLLDLITNFLSGQFQGGQLQGVTPFQGIRPGEVPFGPLQQQAFGLAGGLAPGIGTGIDLFGQALAGFDPAQGQGFLGQAGRALETGLGFDPTQDILQAFEPSRQLALRGFQEDIVPNLLERFGATSGPSGPLNQALAEAGADLQLGLSAQTAPFIGQAALQQPGLQFAGAGLGGQLAGVPGQLAQQGTQLGGQATDLLSQLFNIGGLQQQLPRGQAAAQQARFQEAQPQANPFLSRFGGLALGTPAFTTVLEPQGPSAAQSLLPGLGSFIGGQTGGFLGGGEGGGILGGLSPTGGTGGDIQLALQLAGLFSDAGLKTDIETIPNALDKIEQLDGKTFKFINGTKSGGVIAQEVEKIMPDAVGEIDGIKTVDYTAIIGLLISAVKELTRKVKQDGKWWNSSIASV